MKYLAISMMCILFLGIPFILKGLLMLNKRNEDAESNIIKQPKFYLYVGVIGMLFYDVVIPALCFLEIDPSMVWYESLVFCFCLFIPFNLLSIYLILLAMNWKVVVFDTYVEYYSIFKKKKIFKFSEYQVKKYSASVRITKKVKNHKKQLKTKTFANISSYCSNYLYLWELFNNYKNLKKDK